MLAKPEAMMFCDGCGTAVQPGQAFCSRCGKQVVGPVTAFQPRRSRVQEHVHLLGILWLAVSALTTIGAVVLFIIANTLFPHLHEMGAPPEMPTKFLHVFLSVIALFVMVKAAAGFITGWGLLHREPWARVLALVMGFISLFNIPFGTAVGVYTMWVLLPGAAQQEYDALVASRAA
ncbi:MAG: zinc ribbon domain-containing protein [Candidatus Sulfotelmatobacter sp.]